VMAEKTSMIPTDWQGRLPHNSAPYNTTIVFLVRAGNPKGIEDWDDLAQPGIEVVTPNPKTSGGARLNYLAAWGYALRQPGGNETSARELLRAIYANTDGLEPGARDSTTKFAQNETGDVLITWENEAFLVLEEFGADKVEIVVPSVSILAEPPVTVVDLYATAHGTQEVAKGYLEYLYSPVGQRLAAKHYFRPSEPEHAEAADLERFVDVERFSVDEVFGSWREAQETHFDDGGVFDEIYAVGN
jgi:sulfate/thiosulfate transport system substrate-binding protein